MQKIISNNSKKLINPSTGLNDQKTDNNPKIDNNA